MLTVSPAVTFTDSPAPVYRRHSYLISADDAVVYTDAPQKTQSSSSVLPPMAVNLAMGQNVQVGLRSGKLRKSKVQKWQTKLSESGGPAR